MATQPPPPKGVEPASPIFVPFLLCPNGWMHQDATWYGSRPPRKPHCIRRVPSAPRKGHSTPSFMPMYIVATIAQLSYCWALVYLSILTGEWPSMTFLIVILIFIQCCNCMIAVSACCNFKDVIQSLIVVCIAYLSSLIEYCSNTTSY